MVPDQNNRVFCTSLLVPLPKRGSSDVRPIAIPNCFMKRTENILCRKVQSAAVAFLNPTVNEPASSSSPPSSAAPKKSADQKITTGKYNKVTQHSFGLPSGASKAVLRVKSVMELNPSWVSVSIDMKNAFNSVDLDFMFKVWADEIARAPPRSPASDLRCLLPYLNYRYKSEQRLKMLFDGAFYKGQHRSEDEIDVRRGTLQGASLSPLLFNIALASALRVLEERSEDGIFAFQDLVSTSFADDIVIPGDSSTVIRAIEAIVAPLTSAGLNIKYVKVLPHSTDAEKMYSSAFAESVLSKHQGTEAKFELRPPLDTLDYEAQAKAGLSFVGVPVGTDRFVATEVEESVCEAECVEQKERAGERKS